MKHYRLYIWQCGHVTPDKANHCDRNYLVCPRCHGGYMMGVKMWCQRCGKYRGVFAAKFSSRKFCSDCRKAIKKESNAAPSKNEKPMEKDAIKASLEKKPDCKFYLVKCLREALKNKKDFKCTGCRHYWPVQLDPMNFVRSYSPLAMAAEKFPVYTQSQMGVGTKKGVSPLELAKAKN